MCWVSFVLRRTKYVPQRYYSIVHAHSAACDLRRCGHHTCTSSLLASNVPKEQKRSSQACKVWWWDQGEKESCLPSCLEGTDWALKPFDREGGGEKTALYYWLSHQLLKCFDQQTQFVCPEKWLIFQETQLLWKKFQCEEVSPTLLHLDKRIMILNDIHISDYMWTHIISNCWKGATQGRVMGWWCLEIDRKYFPRKPQSFILVNSKKKVETKFHAREWRWKWNTEWNCVIQKW